MLKLKQKAYLSQELKTFQENQDIFVKVVQQDYTFRFDISPESLKKVHGVLQEETNAFKNETRKCTFAELTRMKHSYGDEEKNIDVLRLRWWPHGYILILILELLLLCSFDYSHKNIEYLYSVHTLRSILYFTYLNFAQLNPVACHSKNLTIVKVGIIDYQVVFPTFISSASASSKTVFLTSTKVTSCASTNHFSSFFPQYARLSEWRAMHQTILASLHPAYLP